MIKITTTVSRDNTKSHTIAGLADAELTMLGNLVFAGLGAQRGAATRSFANTMVDLIEDVEGDAAPTDLMALKEAP